MTGVRTRRAPSRPARSRSPPARGRPRSASVPDRAAVGRQRRGAAARPAAARRRAGGRRGAHRAPAAWPGVAVQRRHAGGVSVGRLDVPARRARPGRGRAAAARARRALPAGARRAGRVPRPRVPAAAVARRAPAARPARGVEGLYVAAGHGPWGISLGPGSARAGRRGDPRDGRRSRPSWRRGEPPRAGRADGWCRAGAAPVASPGRRRGSVAGPVDVESLPSRLTAEGLAVALVAAVLGNIRCAGL